MLDLTFGEQVKIILSRKGMTIKELAETIEAQTGKKMSRQNLTQRLGRDNFQEQDMRMIAEILGCPFQLSILGESILTEKTHNNIEDREETASMAHERDITIGELVEIHEALNAMEETAAEEPVKDTREEGYEETIEESAAEAQEEASETVTEAAVSEEEPVAKNQEEPAADEAEQEEDKKEEPEKKVRGWRAYLMRRKKKQDAEKQEDDQQAEYSADEYADKYTEGCTEDYAEAGYEEEADVQEEQAEKYAEEGHIQEDQTEEGYVEEGYAEEYRQEAYEQEIPEEEEDLVNGDVNPYTGREYQSNSVRMHPSRIGYVQVYDRSIHAWTDMTEWAFLGYQERKKALLGKDYDPPIYLD